jgi:hypothetical protein
LKKRVGVLGLEVHVAELVDGEDIVGGEAFDQAGGGVVGE